MLKFNDLTPEEKYFYIFYLNTSNVKVQCPVNRIKERKERNLNTSNVKVQSL